MLNETLKGFYYGNPPPAARKIIQGSDTARAVAELAKAFPPELRPALDRVKEARAERDSLMVRDYYVDGFKTGALFMMDILDDTREDLEPITEWRRTPPWTLISSA